MTRARCNHCSATFTVGETRDCCLRGAVAEQDNLRRTLGRVRSELTKHKTPVTGSVNDLQSRIARVFGARP